MTTLVTSDLHLSENPRDSYRHDFVKSLPDYAHKYKAKCFIILGDLCEKKDRHGSRLVNQVVGYIAGLSLICPVIINRGNHDYLDPDNPFYRFLGHLPNVTWINSVTEWQLNNALFLPHTYDYKKDWKGIKFDDYDCIFAHNTFKGAKSESGRELDGIPLDVFPKKARVISGDVHVPQRLGPVIYVGAPYTVDFGDRFEPRMLLIQNGKVDTILCTGPQKRLVEFNITKPQDWKVPTYTFKGVINPGDIVKVRVNLRVQHYARWPEIKEAFQAWASKHKYILDHIQPVVEKSERTIKSPTRSPQSDDKLIRDYAKSRQADEASLNTGLWLKEGT